MTGHFDRFDRPNLHFDRQQTLLPNAKSTNFDGDFATLQKHFAFKDTGETAAAFVK